MERIEGSRGSGKTTKLLRFAAQTESIFVASNVRYAKEIAKQLNLDVKIVDYSTFLNARCGRFKTHVIDELDCFLQYLNVIGYSNTMRQ